MNSLNFSIHKKAFLPHLSCEVDLELRPGSFNILMGENGIGKSTLLSEILRRYQVNHRMVLASQSPLDFFFDRSVAKFKEIIQSSHELDHALFEEFWKVSRLHEKSERFLSRLSGGESQLLKLISICSLQADIFLLDEPGQYLDPEKKQLIADLLRRLISKNKTVLMVEHGTAWYGETEKTIRLYVENETLKRRDV